MNEHEIIEKIIQLHDEMLIALCVQITYTIGFISYIIWYIWRQR